MTTHSPGALRASLIPFGPLAALLLAIAVPGAASAMCYPQPDCLDPDPVTPANAADPVSQVVPATMTAGQSYSVTVRMQNIGTNTWTAATGYKLGSQNPTSNTTWGPGSVALPASTAPGAVAVFTFNVTAPATPGTYNFQWMMQKGTAWFDTASTNVAVVVQSGSGSGGSGGGTGTGNVAVSYRGFVDYDEEGRVRGQRGNNGQNVRYAYSAGGQLASVKDSLDRSITMTRNEIGQLVSIQDAAGATTAMVYDASGRVKKQTDARGLATQSTYDGFGSLRRVVSPDTGTTVYGYDAYGRRTSATQGSGTADARTFTYGYDALSRVTSVTAGAQSQTFAYDTCTNGKGRLCSITDPNGSVAYTYTPQGLLASQAQVIGTTGINPNVAFAYDGMGHPTSVTYPNGDKASYTWSKGKLVSATTTIGAATATLISGVKYAPMGSVNEWTFGNGLVRKLAYDLDGRLTAITTTGAAGMQSLTYRYDANNLVTSITNGRDASQNQAYGYNAAGRLTSFGGVSLAYDAVGNRTQRKDNGTITSTLAYGTQNNRVISAAGTVARAWTYDGTGNANGFTGADGVAVGLHYDAFGRIDSSSRNGVTTAYRIDGTGHRTYKAVGSAAPTLYVYSPAGLLLAEYDSGTGKWTNYLYLGSELVGVIRQGQVYFAHNDHLGRTELLTNPAKAIVWSAKLGPFDRTVATDSIGGFNLGFPGQYFDAETGTWYNVNRDYDASIGRYVQSDPLGIDAGVNTYAYVGSNPVTAIDPLGLFAAYICRDGKNIGIAMPINFHNASDKQIAAIVEQIQRIWSGDIGGYNVKTVVMVIKDKPPSYAWDTVWVQPGTERSITADVASQWSTWYSPGYWGESGYAHEAGHLLGLEDSDQTGIMIQSGDVNGARPNRANMEKILFQSDAVNFAKCGCDIKK
jgi:RHS repeat-associated protein